MIYYYILQDLLIGLVKQDIYLSSKIFLTYFHNLGSNVSKLVEFIYLCYTSFLIRNKIHLNLKHLETTIKR